MKPFNSVSATRCPIKAAESERIAAEVAAWEASHGPNQTTPLKPMSDDGMRTQGGKVQLTIVDKRKRGA